MRYKVLPKEGDIGPEEALIQATLALDAAGIMAEKINDVEGMLAVGAMWMKFSEAITHYTDPEAQRTPINAGGNNYKTGVGFQAAPPVDDPEVIIAEENE